MRKKMSREARCRQVYDRMQARHGNKWRTRRDGKRFKAYWLPKYETKKIYRSKALNRACFYKVDLGYTAKEWQAAITHDGQLMIVHVALAYNGQSRITFTKES